MSSTSIRVSRIATFVCQVLLIAVASVCSVAVAHAAERVIPPSTNTFDCSTSKPGDILTLTSGTRGPLSIRNCKGTALNPIVVRNDPTGSEPTTLRQTSGSRGFVLDCVNCVGVEIDGSYKWKGAPAGKTYGIKVTMTGGAGPSAFIRIGGFSRVITIRNVEVDGAWPGPARNGSGIRINDHSIKRKNYPGLWRDQILIEDNYIHNVYLSGMYIGPNYSDGDLPLRDVEVRYNLVEDTGLDGIQTKSMWAGENLVHHNIVRRAGKSSEFPREHSQYSGIKNIGGGVKIYNNWVESTGQHGIVVWTQQGPKISERKGPFPAQIWNNVIIDAGAMWRPFMFESHGISVGAQSGCEKPIPFIYSNTVVDSRQSGIDISPNVGAGFVRDNIVAGTAANPVVRAPAFVKVSNNQTGPVGEMGFTDAVRGNFRLTVNSPAKNQGSDEFPPTDYDDKSRPRDGAPDQGAFEGGGK